MMNLSQHRRLGELLVEAGAISPEILDEAIPEHERTGERLGEVLLKLGHLTEEDLKRSLARQLGITFESLIGIKIQDDVIALMQARSVEHFNVVPLRLIDETLHVAMSDPLDVRKLDELRLHLRRDIEPVFATDKDIREATKIFYGIGAGTMEGMIAKDDSADVVELGLDLVDDISEGAQDASIVRFVNQVIMAAIEDRATDIHIEPLEDRLRIRYRIDGLLYEAAVPASIRSFQSAIISRIKIMADMNIAERRLPQDGKIVIRKGAEDYDLRVSTIPTPYGESVVMRILSRTSEFITLERLGFAGAHLEMLRNMIRRPHGIVFVTGPTGSGKSTTLYAALNEINRLDQKIITIEDPIEYRIDGVSQIQVNPPIGLTFAHCLRTILRQDPDVIMVGETRDTETAQITIRTALTGHLVFSTLHTNDACSAVTRLLDMGIEPFLISSSIEGLLAQRLVRVLCKECKVPYKPEASCLARVNVTNESTADLTVYKTRGCERCRYTGFKGRTAIYELVRITDDFRRLVVDKASANILKKCALADGMKPLRHDGWDKVKAGITTIDEVLRVTLEDEMMKGDARGPSADAPPQPVIQVPDIELPQASQAPEATQASDAPDALGRPVSETQGRTPPGPSTP